MYRSSKEENEWKEISQEQGKQQALSDKQILELLEIILTIENHYGFPCDIEWAFEGGKFYIVQSRPITTLAQEVKADVSSVDPGHTFKFMWGQKQSAMISEGMMWQLMRTLNLKGEFVMSGIPETLFVMKDGIFEHFMPSYSYAHIAKDGIKYLGKGFASMLFSMIDHHVMDFFEFAEKVHHQDVTKASDEELLGVLEKYEMFFNKTFVFFGTSSNWWTDTLTKKIQEILEKNISDPAQREEYFIDLCTPSEIDETMKERLEFSDLVKNHKTDAGDLQKYARRFPALFFNTYDSGEVQKFLEDRARDEALKDSNEEKKRMLGGLTIVQERQKKIYREIADPALKFSAETLQKSAVNRYRLKHVWSGGEYLFLDFLKEISRRMDISFDNFVKTQTFSDIKNFLENKEMLDVAEIEKRKVCFVMHSKGGVVHLLSGQEALDHIKVLLPESNQQEKGGKEIKGQIANKGSIKGIARVVFVKDLEQFLEDSKQFQKGEILVTTMTSPVMIPLIEKASAIVTDEGGICSHAAISAREFKIPCIIGTHGASSQIKTGDMVEVDANSGVIRILNSKNDLEVV